MILTVSLAIESWAGWGEAEKFGYNLEQTDAATGESEVGMVDI